MYQDDRRRSERVPVVCEIALKVGDTYFDCRTHDLSVSGAKMQRVGGGALELLKPGTVTDCWIDYMGYEFEGHCTIVRVSESEIAGNFVGLDVKQHFALRQIIEVATAMNS